ncbi:hypothetical protein, partial [Paraburkholderia bannensis]|uniref:hypothetical protein n=1 Tax=Paraburkholderia bannensis TaxID=765414 RepID=UPI002AB6A0AF
DKHNAAYGRRTNQSAGDTHLPSSFDGMCRSGGLSTSAANAGMGLPQSQAPDTHGHLATTVATANPPVHTPPCRKFMRGMRTNRLFPDWRGLDNGSTPAARAALAPPHWNKSDDR